VLTGVTTGVLKRQSWLEDLNISPSFAQVLPLSPTYRLEEKHLDYVHNVEGNIIGATDITEANVVTNAVTAADA